MHRFLILAACSALIATCASQSQKEHRGSNANEFCRLDAEPGFCKAYFPRWYFNAKQQECLPFVYGGCGGNENRFETQAECEKVCKNAV